MNCIGLSVKSSVYFSERFALKYDGEIMSPSHGRVLCTRVKHDESPCRAVERELARGLLQLPKEGLSSVVDTVVDFTGGRTTCASLRAPCHHAKVAGRPGSPSAGLLSQTLARYFS